jgi:ubiquitin
MTATVTGLTNGTTYTFTVTATNDVGTGPASSASNAVIPATTVGDATHSTVVANPTSVPADGTTTSTITVTLKDAHDNPVSGKTVTLAKSAGPGAPTISGPSPATTDANGQTAFTVTSTTAGQDTFQATDTTDSNLVITQTAQVTFTVGAVDATHSTVLAVPLSVPADGTTTSTITVTLKDVHDNPVSGKTVTLAKSAGPGAPTISGPSPATTDANGQTTFTVTSTTAGQDTFQATDTTDSNRVITQTAQVTFTVPVLPTSENVSSTTQYHLSNSDGSTWTEIDSALRITKSPGQTLSTVLTANSDLWTANAGYNQDLGIFVSDNGGIDQLLAWKESGGFAGTFSPNAAFAQTRYNMTSGHTYVFKLKWKTNRNAPGATIFAGAGPIGGLFSPTSLILKTLPSGVTPNFAVSTQQYTLPSSDGTTWVTMDGTNLATTLSPAANSVAVLGGNVDLFTGNAGFNQDIAIFVSDNGGADSLVAWKESGGSGGIFSPNAAFVKATFPMTGGHTYAFKLKWKTNRNAPGATIFAGAGPISGQFSPTSLLAEVVPIANAPGARSSTTQYTLSNSDGSTWEPVDAGLNVTLSPSGSGSAIVGGNADLFTANSGYNQDIAIFVSDNGGADTLVAWKESGGSAGTFSPNAAFVQALYNMTGGHTYVFSLKWKTNKNAPGTTIFAAAGAGNPHSPTRLTAELTQ